MTLPALSLDALDAAVAALPDNGLSGQRQEAIANLRRDGLPGVREEDWKYTDVSPLANITNAWLESGAAMPAAAAALPDIDADWIVIANGRVDEASLAALPEGVTATRLSNSGAGLGPAGRLGDLNAALLHDGLRLSVGSGVALEKPIGVFLYDHADDQAAAVQARVEILLEENSRAAIVEYQASAGSSDLYSNSVIDLRLNQAAHADFVRIQQRDLTHNQTTHTAVTLDRDASLSHASFDLGGLLVRNDLVVDITAPGAEANFGGLYLVGDGQHIDNHTRVDHRVGPAVSDQEYRGVLDGKARGVWNGKAIVHVGADGTDAQQANHNLLLSKKAEINAKPELEIYADDVKCAHGTTVGQLDETALYYLRTRGLSRRDARQMLTRAFAHTIINRTPIEELHEYIATAVASRLSILMHENES